MNDILETLAGKIDRAALTKAAADVSARYRDRERGLAIQNDTEALAYAIARMPATRAAVERVLAQIDTAPRTILDFGAGPGTAAMAAMDRWPDAKTTLVEPNAAMRSIAQTLLPNAAYADAPQSAEMVIAAYVLNEMPDAIGTAEKLWNTCTGTLVLIDTGTPAGSVMMRGVRDRLIALGAHIHGPCPHHLECPFARETEGWCHFSVRLERSRLHKQLKGADLGYEDEKFTYLIAGRTLRPMNASRIIGYPRIGKVMGLSLCNPDGHLSDAQIAKRDVRYKQAKKSKWGDVF